jgi:hypothetical protein
MHFRNPCSVLEASLFSRWCMQKSQASASLLCSDHTAYYTQYLPFQASERMPGLMGHTFTERQHQPPLGQDKTRSHIMQWLPPFAPRLLYSLLATHDLESPVSLRDCRAMCTRKFLLQISDFFHSHLRRHPISFSIVMNHRLFVSLHS